jgi:antitoxin (DNA-binding transcriptional repressor) of toxin-antitoxin stability system
MTAVKPCARELQSMRNVTVTELRKQVSVLLGLVESGETIHVRRHGKPIAEILPAGADRQACPAWKRPGLRLAVPGVRLTQAVLEERGASVQPSPS